MVFFLSICLLCVVCLLACLLACLLCVCVCVDDAVKINKRNDLKNKNLCVEMSAPAFIYVSTEIQTRQNTIYDATKVKQQTEDKLVKFSTSV